MRDTVETVRSLLEDGREHVSMKMVTDALKVGRSAAYDRVRRALTKGYLVNLAGKDERALKIALGAALPGEDLFLPDGDAVVRFMSGSPTGQENGSTMRESDESSGSPGRPADTPDKSRPGLGDEDFPELVLSPAVKAGHITMREAEKRLELHRLVERSRSAA
jgi:hypothetical protein